MLDKIRQHRKDMGFSNSKLSVEAKLKEELNELRKEIEIPTTQSNLKKELADCIIMITAYCDTRGLDVDEVIDYGIMVNKSRR